MLKVPPKCDPMLPDLIPLQECLPSLPGAGRGGQGAWQDAQSRGGAAACWSSCCLNPGTHVALYPTFCSLAPVSPVTPVSWKVWIL